MKKAILLTGLLIGCILAARAQSITVQSEMRENTDFDQYKTFNWSSRVDNRLDEGLYFLNDLVMKDQIRQAVQHELYGLGYRHDQQQPDLVVNFRVFDKATTMRGMEGYGDGYWGKDRFTDIASVTQHDVEPGTLLISLADRKSGAVVWHGFASGLISDNRFVKDEHAIVQAVHRIFEEYTNSARLFTRN